MPTSAPEKTASPAVYRGRFAPSPTGDLHMGSLVAAVASYLEARTRKGEWLVRVEDLDPPREVPGSADRMLHCLENFGFEWDGDVLFQSSRDDAYRKAIQRLRDAGKAYPCACSRAEIAEQARQTGPEGPVYPGTCRHGLRPDREGRAIRLRTCDEDICFDDRLQGRICQNPGHDIGDFVIRRTDGWFAYQLAVVVDDAWQGVTDVVRGADLLLSTPRQIWLQRQLGLPQPEYLHIPLLLDAAGSKLSKQARSLPVNPARPGTALFDALRLLEQSPPRTLTGARLPEIWDWALKNWQASRLRGLNRLTIPAT
ncbi:MAG TPA: tRNA glutamyl-Q(34) synthetase GluQRS [Gammaproteobacteria bacterium]